MPSKTSFPNLTEHLSDAIFECAKYLSEIGILQTNIESIYTQNLDLLDEIQFLNERIFRLDDQSQTVLAGHRKLTELQDRYDKCLRDLATSEKNRLFLKEQYDFQTQTISMAKVEMEKLRSQKVSDEHLARKLVELVEKNKLLDSDKNKLANELAVLTQKNIKLEAKEKEICHLISDKLGNYDCVFGSGCTSGKDSACADKDERCISCQLNEAEQKIFQNKDIISGLNNEIITLTNNLKIKSDGANEIREDYSELNLRYVEKCRTIILQNVEINNLKSELTRAKLDVKFHSERARLGYEGLQNVVSEKLFCRKSLAKQTLDIIAAVDVNYVKSESSLGKLTTPIPSVGACNPMSLSGSCNNGHLANLGNI